MVSTTPAFSFDVMEHSVRARADANLAALSSLPHATDEAPLWARGVLLLLILAAHLAGLVALSNMNGTQTDARPSAILRAGWIVPDAAPNTAPEPSAQTSPSVAQSTPTRVATRVATPGRRTRARPATPQARRQTFAPQQPSPEPEPTAVSPAPAENSPPSTPTHADMAAAVEAMTSEEAGSGEQSGGGEQNGGGERGEKSERATGGALDGEMIAPDFKANYLSNPEPEYPSLSRRLREQGTVKLRIHVTERGRANEVTLHESSGYGRLDKAAADAVWRWRFSPARRAGASVAAWVVVPIKFELRD